MHTKAFMICMPARYIEASGDMQDSISRCLCRSSRQSAKRHCQLFAACLCPPPLPLPPGPPQVSSHCLHLPPSLNPLPPNPRPISHQRQAGNCLQPASARLLQSLHLSCLNLGKQTAPCPDACMGHLEHGALSELLGFGVLRLQH